MRISIRLIRKYCVSLLVLLLVFKILRQTTEVTFTKVSSVRLQDGNTYLDNDDDRLREAVSEIQKNPLYNSQEVTTNSVDRQLTANSLQQATILSPPRTRSSMEIQNEKLNTILKQFERNTLLKYRRIQGRIRSTVHKKRSVEFSDYFNYGLVVDWWDDICLKGHPSNLKWHPFFPKHPKFTTFSKYSSDRSQYTGKFFRRIHGYVYTDKTGFYDFAFLTKEQGSFIMVDSKVTLFSYMGFSFWEAGFKIESQIFEEQIKEQDKIQNNRFPYYDETKSIWMKAYRLYFVEIVQSSQRSIHFQLLWRQTGRGVYKEIAEAFLLHDKGFLYRQESAFFKFGKPNIQQPVTNEEKVRNDFHKIPVLQSDNLIYSHLSKPKYRKPKIIKELYDGFNYYLDWSVAYPNELFNYSKTYFTQFTPEERLVLEHNEANDVAQKTFNLLNNLHGESLEFVRIVHVRRNTNKTENIIRLKEKDLTTDKKWYFVEIDVRKNGRLLRASHYMKPMSSGGLGFISNYRWQEKVLINIITVISNQNVWFEFMLRMLEKVQEESKEKNIKLIVVDCGSTDGDYGSVLANSQLPHKYLRIEQTQFNKVKALNYGIRNIGEENSIGFVMDLHLQLPTIIFDRIRKMTIKGLTVFTPTLLQLGCGEHEEYTKMEDSIWLDTGTGMLAMYKQDWLKIEGYNEKMYTNKWGGEDWEILDRVVKKGYTIHHFRMARFYHLFHVRKGRWYETTTTTTTLF